MRKRAIIRGTGSFAPERVIKNSYFDELYKKDIDTFLRTKRNISERRWIYPEQKTSDLIMPAAEAALKDAGLRPQDLDLIIVATDTPDYLSPSTAAVVHYRLGCTKAGCFDINTACAGFVTALDVANQYITNENSHMKNILVVGAYAMSKWLNFDDYKIASIFADGAGAAVVSLSTEHPGVLASTMYTDGQYHDYMGIYAGGSARPITHEAIEKKEHLLAFPKRIPPETNGIHWPRLINTVLDRIHKTPQDVNLFLMTQFNIESIHETLNHFKLPHEKAHTIMDRFGYTGSASIAMALDDARKQGKIKHKDLILFVGSGGGMAMTALAMEWADGN